MSRNLPSCPKCNARTELVENSWRSPNCRHCQAGAPAHQTASAGTCTSTWDHACDVSFPITHHIRVLPGRTSGFLRRATLGHFYFIKSLPQTDARQLETLEFFRLQVVLEGTSITRHTQHVHIGGPCLSRLR